MSRISILYDSRRGQTEKIALRIAEVLRDGGDRAVVQSIVATTESLNPAQYECVIIGASVHGGKHSRAVTTFVRHQFSQLTKKPAFFFSVSLSAAGVSEQQQANARGCLENFLGDTGWRPSESVTFAGALLYRKYNWFLRWMMKRIARKEGGDTDSSRDYEYTDWKAVEEFARRCSAAVGPERAREALERESEQTVLCDEPD